MKLRTAALAAVILSALLAPSMASGSTAEVVKVKGKTTLGLVGAKGEKNWINIQLAPGRKHFILKDEGQRRNFDDVVLSLAGDSLPGCEIHNPITQGGPEYDQIRCEVRAIKQVVLDLRDGDDSLNVGDGYYKWTEYSPALFVKAGPGNDVINGGPKRDIIEGGPGKDIINGMRGNDVVNGGPGKDSLAGDEQYISDKPPRKGGNDLLVGGPGNDILWPGSGRDMVKGGSGNDTISSVRDGNRDYVDCGAGRNDALNGVDHRGIRFAEKAVIGCETVGTSLIGGITWKCGKRKCIAHVSPFSARPKGWTDPTSGL